MNNSVSRVFPNFQFIQTGSEPKSDVPDYTSATAPLKLNQPSEVHQTSQPYMNHNSSYPSVNTGMSHETQYATNQNQFYFEAPVSTLSSNPTYIPNSRKSVRSEFEMDTPVLIDEDDHKYRRRSPFESLSRWIK